MQVYLCERCGKPFEARLSDHRRYCGHSCGNAAWREFPREERFWAKVCKDGPEIIPGSPCWDFSGGEWGRGYRAFWDGQRTCGAHQFAYRIQAGEIPPGSLVCHHCDRRSCVRGSHLFTGTHKDNFDDMAAKGRGLKGRGVPMERRQFGERHHHHKLTTLQVTEIRERRRRGELAQAIADELGVNVATVYGIAAGRKRPQG